MARYLVTGSIIINDIYDPSGSSVKGILGGSIYAVNGILPYTDDVLFLSSAGDDFDSFFGEYYERNGLSKEGIEICFPKTQYTKLEYSPSGEWIERSIYGEEYDRLYSSDSSIKTEYILKHSGEDVKGIYFESSVNDRIWDDLPKIRECCPNARIMSEIYTSDTKDPVLREKVFELIKKIDIYSLNQFEAMDLFQTKNNDESIQTILDLNKPCFFRQGKMGASMIQDGKAWFMPSYESEESIDSTGCGNCSTAASLYGYCEGFEPLRTAAYANVAAGVNARQFGPYPVYDDLIKKWMKEKAEELYKEYKEK